MLNDSRGVIGKNPTTPYTLHPNGPQPAIGHPQRVVWRSDTVIVFQDDRGQFWRYARDNRTVGPVIVGRADR
jgi:hypothetical protein